MIGNGSIYFFPRCGQKRSSGHQGKSPLRRPCQKRRLVGPLHERYRRCPGRPYPGHRRHNKANPFFHSASDQWLRSRPGSWRQNRSGQTAMKPCAASSSATSRACPYSHQIFLAKRRRREPARSSVAPYEAPNAPSRPSMVMRSFIVFSSGY